MGVGLGSLIDLNRKLQNNKNLLTAKKAKSRLKKTSTKIVTKEKKSYETKTIISETELIKLKKNISYRIKKENRKEAFYTVIKVLLLLGVVFSIIFLI